MSGTMTCGQCGQQIVGAITTRPKAIEAHNSLCAMADLHLHPEEYAALLAEETNDAEVSR